MNILQLLQGKDAVRSTWEDFQLRDITVGNASLKWYLSGWWRRYKEHLFAGKSRTVRYHQLDSLLRRSFLSLCEDTLGEDEEWKDEEGQSKYGCQNGTKAICPFALSFFHWKISKGEYIIFEHLSSVINFIWSIFYVCSAYQSSIQIMTKKSSSYISKMRHLIIRNYHTHILEELLFFQIL
jgi:hypothetical protein